MWTKSACVVLAWGILLTLVAVGMKGSARPAQANIRIASSTTNVTLTSTMNVAAASAKATNPAVRYVVQPGDTLSGIAAALAVRGGWPALYAANRRAIGPDPNTIHSGTVLTVARPAAAASPSSGPGRRTHQAPPPVPAPTRHGAAPTRHSAAHASHGAAPVRTSAPAPAGMPSWLATMLLAVGLLIGAAFLAELVLVAVRRYRRRQPAARRVLFTGCRPRVGHRPPGIKREPFTGWGTPVEHRPPATSREPFTGWGSPAEHPPPTAKRETFTGWGPRVVVADYDRLVVTHSRADDTVYVLRPPGEDPRAILRVARLVLKEDPYQELAAKLGVPASWPME